MAGVEGTVFSVGNLGEATEALVAEGLVAVKDRADREVILRAKEKVRVTRGGKGPAQDLFLIKHGVVRVYRLNESGGEIVLSLLGSGDCFGEMGLFTDFLRTAWVEAVTEVWLYQMRKADFRGLLLSTPELCWQMLGVLSQRLAKMDEQMENLTSLNVEERLLKALRMLAQDFGRQEGENWVLPPNLTHQLLGGLIGTSRETITRTLGRLARKGLVKRDRGKLLLSRREHEMIRG